MVYGDMLCYFTDLFRQFDYFQMKPEVVASYSKRSNVRKITGVFQYAKKGELKQEQDTLADTNVPTLWTRETLSVTDGFIQKDDELYRIVNPADWLFEGGFNVYILESFIGNSDKQTAFEDVNIGQGCYD